MGDATAALPLRELILSALAEAFISRQSAIGACRDCDRLPYPCDDHRSDLDLGRQYETAYNRVAAGSPEWARLAVTLAGAMNLWMKRLCRPTRSASAPSCAPWRPRMRRSAS